eukprot:363330-Chlamydomonas_euryale.AAC.19
MGQHKIRRPRLATGTITACSTHPDDHSKAGKFKTLKVLLHTGEKIGVAAIRNASRAHAGGWFFKCAFQLALAYAITGHASQGATIPGPVLNDVRSGFAPGLVYVTLSRV